MENGQKELISGICQVASHLVRWAMETFARNASLIFQ